MLVAKRSADSCPIQIVFEDEFAAWSANQPPAAQAWIKNCLFKAERNRIALLPNSDGAIQSVLVGAGKADPGRADPGRADPGKARPSRDLNIWHVAGLAARLPEGRYHIANTLSPAAAEQVALGWLYGQYRFGRYKKAEKKVESKSGAEKIQTLYINDEVDIAASQRLNAGCSLTRDLINTPANDMTPNALAAAALRLADRFGASHRHIVGDELLQAGFPTIHAVGRASATPPQLVDFQWGDPAHPKVTLVGKGVCFDTGGLDLKPSASMLLMKKDMGGAACVLGLAQLIMAANLPIRLRVIIPAVENSVGGNAFRPSDVLETRAGLSVEVGNTDAEGRLVLCDALALADEEQPDLLIDLATLTGAARVALGPEIPALMTDDESLSAQLVLHGAQSSDPLWSLPLWSGYEDDLSSRVADLNNVSSTGFAGAIIGGLFLRRFIHRAKAWAHIDLYAWNNKEQPGRPVGAEPQTIRALYRYLQTRYS